MEPGRGRATRVTRASLAGWLWLVFCGACGPPAGPPGSEQVCNGSPDLCAVPFDQLVLAGTHNSMSNMEDGWFGPHQQYGLARQLEDGIRGMLLDTKEWNGDLYLCHSDCDFGAILLSEALGLIRDFLLAHPTEVMAIIFQDAISPEQTASAFAKAGLDDLVYTHPPGAVWPRVGEMVEANTRLLVTAEFSGPPPAWYHHAWDLFQDTHYAFEDLDSMHCESHRGTEESPLFLVNHWLAGPLGLPLPSLSEEANQAEVLWAQLERCEEERGLRPNLIAVDFYAVGDLLAVVDALNGLAD
ncbi:MAG: hypothetical protein VX498_05690 [Myxococcota bacterium]|nr:hypothetical protein [Myxococcota bacterium]